MSGLYNMLFGQNPFAPLLTAMLTEEPDKIPRFRDCYISQKETGNMIAIHTRTGGGNRQDYEEGNTYLQSLPGYSYDEDMPFDKTYATFYYTPAECDKELVNKLATMGAVQDPENRWKETLAEMESGKLSPQTQRGVDLMGPMIEHITKVMENTTDGVFEMKDADK